MNDRPRDTVDKQARDRRVVFHGERPYWAAANWTISCGTEATRNTIALLSGCLEANRREYYDRLQGVRERGEMQEWLQFFLTAVKFQAHDSVKRAGRIIKLRERYIAEAALSRSSLGRLVDLLFKNPYVTVRRIELGLTMTNQGARNLIREAEKRGWLKELGVFGRGGRTYWYAEQIFSIIEEPFEYEPQ